MDKLDIILTVVVGGFGLVLLNAYYVEHYMEFTKFFKDDVKDKDRRLCRLEGAFSSKEFCAIKNERSLPKAE